jgi:uncharacterized protein (TIGR03437 family)
MTAAAVLLGVPAEAAYQYVFYNRNFQGIPIRGQFDLTALPNKTVTFFVTDTGPGIYYPNDSFGSVLGEIKQAIAAWNSVGGSSLRVAFGGLETQNQPQNAPGGDVIFTDLPPGLLGMGSPNLPAVPVLSNGPNGQFVAIKRSTVMLTANTSKLPGPSYLEGFFTTAVHEFGHALGLQHTWTSSAMSQDIVRNTSRARPLDADDIASLLTLYGAPGWTSNYGSISGTVRFSNGQPVTLASVVAIPPNGPAVSALTNPDGSYTINGLPPNSYFLYAHPLPPDAVSNGAGLLLPTDLTGRSFPASGPFQTVFYPASLSPQTAIQISAGVNVSGQNFSVQSKSSVPMYDAVTYSYLGPNQTPISPAYVNTSSGLIQFVEQDYTTAATPVPQSVSILGGNFGTAVVGAGAGAASIVPYNAPQIALELNFFAPLFAGTGPRHLLFNLGNDIFVLPNGLNLTQKDPPMVNSVTQNFDGSVTITGTNFGPDSRVFFDGLQATGTFSGNSFNVTPPPGSSGQISTVTVFNSDGQNSMFLQQQNPPTYTYPAAGTPFININPTVLTAGTSPIGFSSMVDITGVNTNFVSGQTSVGFGTSDVSVSNVWVLSPTHLIANVMVAPNAVIGASEVSVISGFQVAAQPFGFQIQAWSPSLPLIALPVVSTAGGPVYSGGFASIYGLNLSPASGAAQVALNGVPMSIQYSSANQVNFQVPAGFPSGPAILKLNNGAGSASVVVEIDIPPPSIIGITDLSSAATLDVNHAASAGDLLGIQVTGLDPTVLSNLSRLQVTVAGIPMAVFQVTPSQNGQSQIQFALTQSFGGSPVPVVVLVDGSPSGAYVIVVH